MLPTYRAVLHGDRLEWADDVPEHVRGEQRVPVFVTIVGDPDRSDGQRVAAMADALQRLATRGGLSIADASTWQREQREDRPLPGRVP